MTLSAESIADILAETKCRVAEGEQGRGDGVSRVTRFWQDVSLEALDACVQYLVGMGTVSTPMAGTMWELAGDWKGGRVFFKNDGLSGRIDLYQELVKVGTVELDGATGDSCRYSSTTTWYFSVAELPVLPEATAGVMYSMGSVSVNPETGLITTWIERREHKQQVVDAYTSRLDASQTDETAQVLGTTDPGSALSIGTLVGGQIKTREVSKNEDCTSDVTLKTSAAIDQQATSYEAAAGRTGTTETHTQAAAELADPGTEAGKIKRASSRPTEFGRYATELAVTEAVDQETASYERTAARSTTTQTHTQGDELTAPQQAEGYIRRVSNRPTEFGLFATESEEIEALDQQATVSVINASETVARNVETQGNLPAEQTAPPGAILRVSATPTEFGKFAVTTEVVGAVDQVGMAGEDSAARSSSTQTHTQAADGPASPTAAAGEIKRVASRPTEFGLFATEETTQTAKDQTVTVTESNAARTAVKVVHTQAAAAPTATAGTGEVVQASAQPTEFGLLATTLETVTAVDQTATVTESNAARTAVKVIHTQAAAEPTATASAGEIVQASAQPTEFGLFATSLETVTAVDQTATSGDADYLSVSSRTVHTQAASAVAAPTQAGGVIKRVSNRPTEFGLTETVEETVTATARTATYTRVDRDDESVSTDVKRNQNTLPNASVSVGTISEVSGQFNQFGLYDFEQSTRTAKAQTISKTWANRFGTCSMWAGKNVTEGTFDTFLSNLSLDDTTNNTLWVGRNEFGLVDYRVTKEPYQVSGGTGKVFSVSEDEQTFEWKERTTLASENKFLVITWTRHTQAFREQADLFAWLADATDAEHPHYELFGGAGGWWVGLYDVFLLAEKVAIE